MIKLTKISSVIVGLIGYFFMAFYVKRHDFPLLIFTYSLLFLLFLYQKKMNLKYIITIGLFYRLSIFLAVPWLSQDFYRFIWDGNLITQGISPYLHLPIELSSQLNYNFFVLKMGELSAHNYSNYPPFSQYIFAFSSYFSFGNFKANYLILKLLVLLGDILVLYFGSKILVLKNLNIKNIGFYFLNPLVILECVGNLHFEGIMMGLFCTAYYLYLKEKKIISAVFLALSIGTKLIPIFYLAAKAKKIQFSKQIGQYALVLFFLVLLSIPFFELNAGFNFGKSIGLWFGKFEFNAGFYYVIREIGYKVFGYNINALYSKTVLVAYLLYFFWNFFSEKAKDPIKVFLYFLLTYFLLSTTVHPWYIISLVCLGSFIPNLFTLYWSWSVFLSYAAYKQTTTSENYWLIALEYLPIFYLLVMKFKENINLVKR